VKTECFHFELIPLRLYGYQHQANQGWLIFQILEQSLTWFRLLLKKHNLFLQLALKRLQKIATPVEYKGLKGHTSAQSF